MKAEYFNLTRALIIKLRIHSDILCTSYPQALNPLPITTIVNIFLTLLLNIHVRTYNQTNRSQIQNQDSATQRQAHDKEL